MTLPQHVAAALEPVHLDHLGLPGFVVLLRTRGGSGFGRGSGQVFLGHVAGPAVQLDPGPTAGNAGNFQG